MILNANGTFDTAEEFPAKTFEMVPTTPQAESRVGDNCIPFPLADQLKYLICGADEKNNRFEAYIDALTEWSNSQDAPGCLRILTDYLKQKTLLQDLTERAHLKVKYGEGENYGKGNDAKSMILFSVHSTDGEDRLWMRSDVRESWSRRISGKASSTEKLCYATGTVLPAMENHPKIQGNAKLVSSKDAEFPFVYKGRFTEDGSAASVSYEAASKAYNALDWLVQKQGFRKYGMTVVAWNTNGATPPKPLEPDDYWEDEDETAMPPDTFESYARTVRDAALGWRNEMSGYDKKRTNETVILGLEAATDGRMSVNYYQEIPSPQGVKDDYVSRLENWYLSCRWGKYNFKIGQEMIFTPKPHEIAAAALGVRTVKTADGDKRSEKPATKQMRQLYLRLLSCITLGRPLPRDIVKSAVNRSVQPQQFRNEKDNTWQESLWRECVSTTCALIYKKFADEGKKVFNDANLMEREHDRSYLFGRLLAIADYVEADASGRRYGSMTNAIMLMPMFVQRPNETWMRLHGKLIPYLGKLDPARAGAYQKLFGRVESLFLPEERKTDLPLTEMFLPGYYSQRQELYRSLRVPEASKETDFEWPKDRSALFGCMAAIAENAEVCESKRERIGKSNVLNYMNMLIQRPVDTWAYIHERTIPYMEKLGFCSLKLMKLLRCCEERFDKAERAQNTALDSGFLHGYYVMLWALTDRLHIPTEKVENQTPESRDDVFGALLKTEDYTERFVMDKVLKMNEKDFRHSNAVKYMSVFARRPFSVWTQLKEKMLPYQKRLPDGGHSVEKQINMLEKLLKDHGWDTDEQLDGSYLNHFYRS